MSPTRPTSPALLLATIAAGATLAAQGSPARADDPPARGFVSHTIDTGLTGGYQAVVTDLNRDGKPDILALASGLKELRWYENPGWQRHVLVSGVNRPINAAAHDVDGDGIPEIGLAHEFAAVYAKSIGIISILTQQGDPTRPWSIKEIDRLPTSHRLRFADVAGDGKKVLVNFPLIGSRALAPDYRDRVPLVVYRPGAWTREIVTNDEEGVVHGILIGRWEGRHEALLSASMLGVHAHRLERGRWTRARVVSGDATAWPKSGASDVAIGRLGRERFVATIEPWHGHQVAVYRRHNGAWTRHIIDAAIADGHTISAGDFDNDGRDEIVVGERQGRRSAYVYRIADVKANRWTKEALDPGDMAAAGCALADLNADRRLDIVCIGTSTANLKWFENRNGR